MLPMKNTHGVNILPITAEDTYPLRHQVLWPHKSLSAVHLPSDSSSIHLGAYAGEARDSSAKRSPIGVITICVSKRENLTTGSELDLPTEELEAQFRKFAVAPEWQGRGVGSKLLEHAAVVARDAGARTMWCDARTSALSFYQRFGMQTESSPFMRKEVEYVKMRRILV
jgi:ribosomal protein S18 acetylase RimI-like enzyme